MTTSTPEPPAPVEPDPGPRPPGDALRDLAGLRRSRSDKLIAGVAGGIARHLDIDPLLVRVVLAVLVFFGGAGVIIYVACWLLVPLEDRADAPVRLDERTRSVALVLVGVIALLALLGDSLGSWGFPWPLAILAAVVALVMLHRGRQDRLDPPAPPLQGQAQRPLGPDVGREATTAYAAPRSVPRARRGGPLLFWYTLALITIGVGVLGTVDLAGVDVVGSAYPALALITCAVMLLLGSFWGRPGGLILLGLVSVAATVAFVVVGELEVDRFSSSPATSADLRPAYDLDVGEIDLDLNDVGDLEALDGRRVDLEVGLGRIEVMVPDRLDVMVVSDLGAGDSTVFGTESDGGTATDSLDGGVDVPTLTLHVTVGLGEIEIARDGGR